MAYQAPIFYTLHAWADAGTAALELETGTIDSDFPLYRVQDSRVGPVTRYTPSASTGRIRNDRGSGTLEDVDTLIIPAGHTLSGDTVTLYRENVASPGAADSGWSTIQSFTAAAGQIVRSFTATDDRWQQIKVVGGSGDEDIPELYWTRARQPTRGPDRDWAAPPISPLEAVPFPTRLSTSRLAPDRQAFRFTFRRVSGTDLEILDEVVSVARDRPIFMRPPDDAISDLVFCKIVGEVQRVQARENEPALGPAYDLTFRLEEQTT